MEHEMIDYYDEDGRHLGIIDKAIAHKDGLWHRSIHVYIINNKNEILLQKRCDKKSFFPSVYDCSVGGHVGQGETTIVSALRECKEEIGIEFEKKDLQFLFTIKEKLVYKEIKSNEFVDVFVIRKDIKVDDLVYQKEEVEDARYFTKEEVFSPNPKFDLLPHCFEYKLLKGIL